MKIQLAHLRDQGVDFAVFDANASSGLDQDRDLLLQELVSNAQASGLNVHKGALSYVEGDQNRFYGAPDLVSYLVTLGGVRQWTHEIDH